MQKCTYFPSLALEPQGYLHARTRLQAEFAEDRRWSAKYPSRTLPAVHGIRRGADTAADPRAYSCTSPFRELHPHAAVPARLPAPSPAAHGLHPFKLQRIRSVSGRNFPNPYERTPITTLKRRHFHGIARPVADCLTRSLSYTACACPLKIANVDVELEITRSCGFNKLQGAAPFSIQSWEPMWHGG
jgi:hypothetical protein